MENRKLKIYADGGARGNPGPAAAGYVIADANDRILEEGGEYLGATTNNQAEYRAIELALEKAKKYNPAQVDCFLDSELIVKQLAGAYRVKKLELKPKYDSVKALASSFGKISFTHITREFNKRADAQVNKILDKK